MKDRYDWETPTEYGIRTIGYLRQDPEATVIPLVRLWVAIGR